VIKERPVNLNLLTIQFPMPAIVSILHRLSGVLLFFFIPALLCLFQQSLLSQKGFQAIHATMDTLWVKFVLWVFLSALIYHFIAGIRHMLLDMEIGESLQGGRLGANITLIVSILLIILTGIWLW